MKKKSIQIFKQQENFVPDNASIASEQTFQSILNEFSMIFASNKKKYGDIADTENTKHIINNSKLLTVRKVD